MFNKISSLTLAFLLFLLLLGSAANFYVGVISAIILLVAATIINYKRLGWNWPHLMLPVFYLLGVGGVFMIVPNPTLRVVFLVFAAILFYLLQANLGRESHLLQNIFLITVFLLYLTVFAFQFYLNLNQGWLVMLVFAVTYVLIVQGFAGFSLPTKKYFKLIIAMLGAQIAWGLSLWPTHYVVNAVIMFCAFYLLWLFSFSAFFGRLSSKKVYWQLTLVSIVVLITLVTARWEPLG
jgi:hypothetical protein